MIGINSNINSLVAQQNLNSTQSALSSAITRLSSGKRINSAADDAAGQAIASRMTSQINGLNQGVSNANDGVSMTQTASSGLNQITDNLQRIRQLAVQSATGSLSSDDQAALQKEVSQRIAEVNRIASQTTYNGTNVLDGSAGQVSFQVGANVGQSISVNLSQNVGASNLGQGLMTQGSTLSTFSNLNLDQNGSAVSGTTKPTITSINVLADGQGGFKFTDQNNQALTSNAVTNLFGNSTTGSGTALKLTTQGALSTQANVASTAQTNAIQAAATANTAPFQASGTNLGNVQINLTSNGQLTTAANATIASIDINSDGKGGYQFVAKDNSGTAVTLTGAQQSAINGLFKSGTAKGASLSAGAALSGNSSWATTISNAAAANVADPSTGAFPSTTSLLGTISGVGLNATGTAAGTDINTVQIYGDGKGGYTFKGIQSDGTTASTAAGSVISGLFSQGTPTAASLTGTGALADATSAEGVAATQAATANTNSVNLANATNTPPKVSDIDISTTEGANAAIEAVDKALSTVNNIQADLGAAQNRFTSIASTQTQQATNLSSAQSQITDANFAQETANLSKAQVLQQAGISVLAQANSMPQQVLKLLG
jgi:flagellin